MPTASELPVDTSASATDMANEMFGNGITVVSATYTGNANASGTYSNGDTIAPNITPSDTGVILSTGNASSVTNSSGDANTVEDTSTNHGTAGDSDLNAVSGQTTFDAAIFNATFIPEGSTLTMQLTFSSEEYLEYVNSGFNDAIGIWVNGTQAKLAVGSGDISIDEINDTSNANLYIDNPAAAEEYNTEMDGFTVTLTVKAPVIPGQENTIKIGIADGGDAAYDSNLLIAGDSVQTALIAGDDDISIGLDGSKKVDLLSNDDSSTGSTLTIVEINGQPVSAGDTVTLPTGEKITLTESGWIVAEADGDIGTSTFTYKVQDTDGNTDVGFVNLTTQVPCFTRGTLIETSNGPIPVEQLKTGDLIKTMDHGLQPLRWVGARKLTAKELDIRPHLKPITIARGALGPGRPSRDLTVSPQHRVLLSSKIAHRMFGSAEVLIAANKLLSHAGISRRDGTDDGVEYYHVLLDDHQIVFSNGMPTESLYLGSEVKVALPPAAQAEIRQVFPQLWDVAFTLPPARKIIRKARKIDELVARHEKNAKALYDLTAVSQDR